MAAELGIFGLPTFVFLVIARLHRELRGDAHAAASARKRPAAGRSAIRDRDPQLPFTDAERRTLELNAQGMLAAMVGWTVCALFASVAFNWTFYYVLALSVAGPRVIAQPPRRGAGRGRGAGRRVPRRG